MLNFETNRLDMGSELLDEIKLFFPYLENCELCVKHTLVETDTELINRVSVAHKQYEYRDENRKFTDEIAQKRIVKRSAKLSVYRALNEYTGINPPWGSLTGIRPSKLVYDMLDEGVPHAECARALTERFYVSEQKAQLIADIVNNQKEYYFKDEKCFNLYIHIPFCTSKCNYCSFTTELVSRAKSIIPSFVECLKRDISAMLDFIKSHGKLCSIYVGGGTPTALDAEQLEYLLSGVNADKVEFTVEAGRPDTITDEKLAVIEKVGATRICVNPQTLNDETLKRIGRSHTADDFIEKYKLARKYNFDINVDLIAGLSGESANDFAHTVSGVLDLRPDNVTVHTLSRKNGSVLKQQGEYDNSDITRMTEIAFESLTANGYLPYYLYRQKQMLGNLENVGYSLPGKQCVNNVTTMEDCMSVVACGAGSITKAVSLNAQKRVTRFADMRDVRLYVEKFEEKLAEKLNFLEKQFTNLA